MICGALQDVEKTHGSFKFELMVLRQGAQNRTGKPHSQDLCHPGPQLLPHMPVRIYFTTSVWCSQRSPLRPMCPSGSQARLDVYGGLLLKSGESRSRMVSTREGRNRHEIP
jgi:hypothetical protein